MLRMKLVVTVLLFLNINILIQAATVGQTKIIVKHFNLKFDEKLSNVTAKLDLLPDDYYAFKFHTDLFVDMPSFLVKIGIALPSSNGKFETYLMNSVADVCKYFKNNNGNMMLKIFFNGHFGNKNFPSSCPIKAGKYFMEDFRINDNLMSIRSMESKFMILVDFCTQSSGASGKLDCFVNMKFHGEARDRKKWLKEMQERKSTVKPVT